MYPVLYNREETEFTSNGIGRLSDCIRAVVFEERNGIYEAEFDYPLTGERYKDIQEGRFVTMRHDDKGDAQPFQIYGRTAPINGIVTFYAHHISYQLATVTVMPYTASSCAQALDSIPLYSINHNPFTFWTDKEVSSNFSLTTPRNAKELLFGSSGSILDVYGKGDYEYDKYTVKLHSDRGMDNGVEIRYGKNLADITHDIDISETYTGIVPYWVSHEDESVVVTLPEGMVVSDDAPAFSAEWETHTNQNIKTEDDVPLEFAAKNIAVIPVDFSESFDTEPTIEQLRNRAKAYLRNNTPWIPDESIDVDFVALWQTAEYDAVAPLQRVSLCDKVSVYYPELGVRAVKMTVIRTEYNCLTERFDKITLGKAKTSLAGIIQQDTTQEILKTVPTITTLHQALETATELIRGGKGGYKVDVLDADGHPVETLYMDSPDINTAVNILRINRNGIAFSRDGYDPERFISAWTIDGHFNANYIDTGTLVADIVKAGVLSDIRNNNWWNLDTGEMKLGTETIIDDPTTPDGTTTLGTFKETTETRLTNTEDGLTLNFNRAMERIQDVDDSQTREFAEWKSYIRFKDGSIILGKEENPITLTLVNDRISFKSSGVEVAYLSDNIMYISNIHVTDSAVINGLSITEVSDGYLIDIQAE